MKIKISWIALLLAFLCNCSAPRYLPSSNEIDVNPYGSQIIVIPKKSSRVTGELIAISNDNLIVLEESTNKCVTIPIYTLKGFVLRYAKPRHYGWTIPLYTLSTISHGLFLIFTAPINIIVTISVTASGENDFRYNHRNMTYDRLKMFARFPQGVPANVSLERIK